jgi:hypothetical protein
VKYKNLSEVLQALADERVVKAADVPARLLRAKVWVSGAGQPGCLYDYGPNYSRSKSDAIADVAFVADDSESGIPRGIKAELARSGSFYHCGIRYEISVSTLGDVL